MRTPLIDVLNMLVQTHRKQHLLSKQHYQKTHISPNIALHPQQLESLAQVRSALETHHGVILANDVGSGKTFVALAAASEYTTTHIIAPPTLLPMWRNAIKLFFNNSASGSFSLHSLALFSRTPSPRLSHGQNTLVIIDEAHHLRNSNTIRYRTIASLIANMDVLLLSATPLHNAVRDVQSLCRLYAPLSACNAANIHQHVIRLPPSTPTSQAATALYPTDHSTHKDAVKNTSHQTPKVRFHPPFRIMQDREVLERLLSIPPPLPLLDGTSATSLIRTGLLRAWCSSDAALTKALSQRILRGHAIRQSLLEGRHPSGQELKSWLGDEFSIQLGFPLLLVNESTDATESLNTLDEHLDALAQLSAYHRQRRSADRQRQTCLERLLAQYSNVPIIAFSQYEATVLSLYRSLRHRPGIAMLTGKAGYIASGKVGRDELLALFAPMAQGNKPPPASQIIHLLLSTDLLAEGVNLQDAGVVVHLDMPWSHALLKQRVGRCARIGSPHNSVNVFRILPSRRASRALLLEQHLLRKRQLTQIHLTGTQKNRSPVECNSLLRKQLRQPPYISETLNSRMVSRTSSFESAPEDGIPVALCRTNRSGVQDTVLVLACLARRGGSLHQATIMLVDIGETIRVTRSPCRLLDALSSVRSAVGNREEEVTKTQTQEATVARTAEGAVARTVEGAIEEIAASSALDSAARSRIAYKACIRWLKHRRIRASLGVSGRDFGGTVCCRSVETSRSISHKNGGAARSDIITRALRVLDDAVNALPVHYRAPMAREISAIREQLSNVRGVGAESVIKDWLDDAPELKGANTHFICNWLGSWQHKLASKPESHDFDDSVAINDDRHWQITAMVVFAC